MKFLILSLTFTFSTFATIKDGNEDLFHKRQQKVLELRKENVLKKIATKINTSYEEVEKNLTFTDENNQISVIGHVNGDHGVCEITGMINLIETSVSGKCISETNKVTIIWP